MEFVVSIKSRIAALALAGIAFAGSMAFTTTEAHARGFGLGWGIGADLLGAAVVGSAIAANDGYYYDGYPRCGWVRQYDAYGNFMGRSDFCLTRLVRAKSSRAISGRDEASARNVRSADSPLARAPHPTRAAPDPPGCPPGRVELFLDHFFSPGRSISLLAGHRAIAA